MEEIKVNGEKYICIAEAEFKDLKKVNECYQSYRDNVEELLIKYKSCFNEEQLLEIENELNLNL